MFSTLVRIALTAVALVLLAVGAAMLSLGRPGSAWLLVTGAALLAGVAFERWRYKRVEVAAGAGFSPTAERFLDPTSGEPVRVWTNGAGERRYVRDTAG